MPTPTPPPTCDEVYSPEGTCLGTEFKWCGPDGNPHSFDCSRVPEDCTAGVGCTPAEGVLAENLARQAFVTTRMDLSGYFDWGGATSLSDAIDGARDTAAHLQRNILDSDWLQLTLNGDSWVSRIVAVSPGDCPLQDYLILVSQAANPGYTSPENSNWSLARHVTGGTGLDDTTWNPPLPIRHVALLFLSDDCTNPGEYSRIWSYNEVTELEVWTPGK